MESGHRHRQSMRRGRSRVGNSATQWEVWEASSLNRALEKGKYAKSVIV